jgi:hypothetical protein
MDSWVQFLGNFIQPDFIFVKNWTHTEFGISIPFTCGIGTRSNILFFKKGLNLAINW